MSDERYLTGKLSDELTERQKHALAKMAEEAAEVSQACLKAMLWGLGSYDPRAPEKGDNMQQIIYEFNDLTDAFTRLRKTLE